MARTVHQKSVLLTLVVAAMAAELRKPGAQGPEDLEPSAGEALRDRLNAGFDRVVGGHEVTEPPILLEVPSLVARIRIILPTIVT